MKKMKTLFIFSGFILATVMVSLAQADLLSRLNIEEVLKERVQQAIKIKDSSAKITVRIDYDKYEALGEDLPGTNFNQESFYADKLDVADIKKINVQYFSTQAQMSEEQSALIYSLIPTEKNKISITFKTVPPSEMVPTGIQPKDLNEIADGSIKVLSIALSVIFGLATLILGFVVFFNNAKNREAMKQQFGSLISSLSENGMGKAAMPQNFETQFKPSTGSAGAGVSEKQIFSDFSEESLAALFADLYWCEKDGVAHYLWSNITTAQKVNLMNRLDFLYAYSMYFSSQPPVSDEILFHPYYSKPLDLTKTSQENLLPVIKKNFALWSKISPLRQQTLPLSLKEKIKANSANLSSVKSEEFPESKPRLLPRTVVFGEISLEDELEIFKDPNLIPIELRSNVASLAWLALRDKEFIAQQFEKLDAKFMASGWIAATEILEALEKHVPEKKLLLLKSYLKSSRPSKSSPAFQHMFKLGLEESQQNHESLQKAS